MRKITFAISSAFAVTALCLSGAAVGLAPNAKAETTAQTKLLAPSSYEEYLNLSSPSDVSVTADYTAIADGNTVYVYDRTKNEYFQYEHKEKVTKLQFSVTGELYFLDSVMQLHSLSPKNLTDGKEETEPTARLSFSCNTFFIAGDDLYFTVISGDKARISKTTLSELDVYAAPLVENLLSKPAIAYHDDALYYTDAGRYLWKLDAQTASARPITTFHAEIVSMSVSANEFTCSDVSGNFYSYRLSELVNNNNADSLSPLAQDSGGYSALAAHGENVYAIKKNAVRQYSLTSSAFTEYEICSVSSSTHRTNNAQNLYLSNDTLYIADNGNSRVSVFNTKTQTYQTPVQTTLDIRYLAADEHTLLVADKAQAILYSLSAEDYGEIVFSTEEWKGDLTGATSVYGNYYLTTNDRCYYQLSQTANETAVSWQLTQTERADGRTATLLTADAYGYLYAASGARVYRYSESEFMNATAEGELLASELPDKTEKFHVDYQGNLYALANGKLYEVGNDAPFALNTPLVYAETANVQAFAFGIEENIAYVLYQENYLATTTALDLPTVRDIPVNQADEYIFAPVSAVVEVVQTNPNAFAVEFDIAQLNGAEVFPYLSYERYPQSLTALKIGETAPYNVLAVYDESVKAYRTYLVLGSQCTPLPTTEYRADYETPKTGYYLTNDAYLYKYPYLTTLLTVTRLEEGKPIALLGEIDKLDHAYYLIEYVNEANEVCTGYIPKAFASPVSGAPTKPHKVLYGDKADNDDTVFRLIYLLLGSGVICILTDILILRKRRDD